MVWCCRKTLALQSIKKSSRGDEILDFRIALGFLTVTKSAQPPRSKGIFVNLYSWRIFLRHLKKLIYKGAT
jgi:hypothetical protein